jgi:hypothetical protein
LCCRRSTRFWPGRRAQTATEIPNSWNWAAISVRFGPGSWRLDNLRSFDEYLERKFPESRRKAYYLMAIHEHLPRIPKSDLKSMGWTKARELVKVVRSNGRDFDCAPWVHKAIDLPREEFKREVEKHLTGQETEPWGIIYFKVYKSQLPVIERALETAGLILGSDKSRGYCWR